MLLGMVFAVGALGTVRSPDLRAVEGWTVGVSSVEQAGVLVGVGALLFGVGMVLYWLGRHQRRKTLSP